MKTKNKEFERFQLVGNSDQLPKTVKEFDWIDVLVQINDETNEKANGVDLLYMSERLYEVSQRIHLIKNK